jgi:septal ring factor EnvC (AmiA/AmiB activator)
MRAATVIIIVMICISLGLGIALLRTQKRAEEQRNMDEESILLHSNQWVQTRVKLDEQAKVNFSLETNLTDRMMELKSVSNKLIDVSGNLAKVEADVKAAQEEIAKRDAKIAELANLLDDKDKKLDDLRTSITGLEAQIAETEKRLTTSEGDKELLLKELKRLQVEKAELERQFNIRHPRRSQEAERRPFHAPARLDPTRTLRSNERKGAECCKRVVALPVRTNYNLTWRSKDGGAKINAKPNGPPPIPPAPK